MIEFILIDGRVVSIKYDSIVAILELQASPAQTLIYTENTKFYVTGKYAIIARAVQLAGGTT